ncbi:MAG: reverse transcriptase family protein [Alphaproteobacteria bacterium]
MALVTVADSREPDTEEDSPDPIVTLPYVPAPYLRTVARHIAAAIEGTPVEANAMRRAIVAYLGPGADHVAWRLGEHVGARWPMRYSPPKEALDEILRNDVGFVALVGSAWLRGDAPPEVVVGDPPMMAPTPAFAGLDLPDWPTPRAMAESLSLTLPELIWLADTDGRVARRREATRRHYHVASIGKAGGGCRLIEAPKRRLRAIQREILTEILDRVAPHAAATAYAKGRSVIDGAARHAGEEVVLTMDLRRFFQSIPARRVHALFRCLGYPPAVARLLTGLTTTRTFVTGVAPEDRMRLRVPHLPQGAPTSPALANLCTGRLDRRLAGLSRRLDVTYTRYADDLAFSGEDVLRKDWVRRQIAGIVADEGFAVAAEKTRCMRASQRQAVTGIVVNRGVNMRRTEYDRLKAMLTNCARHGPTTQNLAGHPAFRQHLDGRITWVEQLNPRRGAKLRAIFDRIAW